VKKLHLLVAAVLGLFVLSSVASASGGANPFNVPTHNGPFQSLFKKKAVPAFQAAPWYLYWPYNSHFQTPAPLLGHEGFGGGGYAPGQGWMNPYFPNHGK
jgi:hypothetical protein